MPLGFGQDGRLLLERRGRFVFLIHHHHQDPAKKKRRRRKLDGTKKNRRTYKTTATAGQERAITADTAPSAPPCAGWICVGSVVTPLLLLLATSPRHSPLPPTSRRRRRTASERELQRSPQRRVATFAGAPASQRGFRRKDVRRTACTGCSLARSLRRQHATDGPPRRSDSSRSESSALRIVKFFLFCLFVVVPPRDRSRPDGSPRVRE